MPTTSDLTTQRRPVADQAADLVPLFTGRGGSYVRFIRAVRYPQGLQAFFLRSPLLRSGLHLLDAGCGTGVLTLAFREALLRRGFTPGAIHAFDLTPAMLERFRTTLRKRHIDGVDLEQANVLQLETLPGAWKDYDLIISASMLEYVPRDRFAIALGNLRARLTAEGRLLLFITRDNWLMRFLIGRWWQSHLYTASQLREAFSRAGFSSIAFRRFPLAGAHLGPWGFIVEARV